VDDALARMKGLTAKPLVVSMGGIAGSGGYHIALRGDRLLADRLTRTGAIGAPTDEASRAFVAEVAEARRLKPAAVDSAAGGRMWMGDSALAQRRVGCRRASERQAVTCCRSRQVVARTSAASRQVRRRSRYD